MIRDTAWLALVLLGHFGLHLTFYNQINATALPRKILKLSGRIAALECMLVALYLLVHVGVRHGELPSGVIVYCYVCLAANVVLGIPWLLARPVLGRGWLVVEKSVETFKTQELLERSPAGTRKCRLNLWIPGNQIFDLVVERKALPVHGLPDAWEGLKIAHFSDLHLTGDATEDYYRFVARQIAQWDPQLVCLTGDVVDKDHCLPWLSRCLQDIDPPLGKFLILGNHDLRVSDPQQIRDLLTGDGWISIGGTVQTISSKKGELAICGNELPWFGPCPDLDTAAAPFRILLSHCPDQINWARRNNIALMLAGHTHGGHGRLPLIGPLISPSHHGSRFASGEFYLPPTTMHVTRGVFSTHLQRIFCPPELSLLTLRQP